MFGIRHYAFLVCVLFFLLLVFLLTDGKAFVSKIYLERTDSGRFSDLELGELLKEGLHRGPHRVEATVKQCEVLISYSYSHGCNNMHGHVLNERPNGRELILALDDVKIFQLFPSEREGEPYRLYVRWRADVSRATKESQKIIKSHKLLSEYANSTSLRGSEILSEGSVKADHFLTHEMIDSRDFTLLCSGGRTGAGVGPFSSSIFLNPLNAQRLHDALEVRRKSCLRR